MYAHKLTSESLNPAVSLTCTLNQGFTNHYARPKTPLFTPRFTGILSLSPKSDCKGTKKIGNGERKKQKSRSVLSNFNYFKDFCIAYAK